MRPIEGHIRYKDRTEKCLYATKIEPVFSLFFLALQEIVNLIANDIGQKREMPFKSRLAQIIRI